MQKKKKEKKKFFKYERNWWTRRETCEWKWHINESKEENSYIIFFLLNLNEKEVKIKYSICDVIIWNFYKTRIKFFFIFNPSFVLILTY